MQTPRGLQIVASLANLTAQMNRSGVMSSPGPEPGGLRSPYRPAEAAISVQPMEFTLASSIARDSPIPPVGRGDEGIVGDGEPTSWALDPDVGPDTDGFCPPPIKRATARIATAVTGTRISE